MRLLALPFALVLATVSACTAVPVGTSAGVDTASTDPGSGTKGDGAAETGPVTDTTADVGRTPDAAVAADAPADTVAASDAAADVAKQETAPSTDADVAAADLPPADAGPADVAPTDAQAPDAIGPKVQCVGTVVSFPTFSKTCGGDGDCFAAYHQVNCCGTMIAIGISAGNKAEFEAAEKACSEQYPGCGCASMQTMAEDGYSAGANPVAVKCAGGKCATYIVGAQMVCTSNGLQEPKPFKWCASDADCAWIPKTIDCCGSTMATGLTKASLSTFSTAEAKCAAQAAVCDCMAKPMVAEDGKQVVGGEPVVVCQNGGCLAKSAP